MFVLLHVAAALLSLLASSVCAFSPTKRRLQLSYGLTALTLGSGFYLVAATKTSILQVCVGGLFYLAAVSILLYFARQRLARQTSL